MTNQPTNKGPIYEIGYRKKIGVDANGKDLLGSMINLAAVFPRTDPTKGGIIRHHTESFTAKRFLGDGVYYLLPARKPQTPKPDTKYPIFEVGFCEKRGKDHNGQDILGQMVNLGTVWERQDPSKGGILKYAFRNASPEAGLGEGVLYLLPIRQKASPDAEPETEDFDPNTGEVYNGPDEAAADMNGPSPEDQF